MCKGCARFMASRRNDVRLRRKGTSALYPGMSTSRGCLSGFPEGRVVAGVEVTLVADKVTPRLANDLVPWHGGCVRSVAARGELVQFETYMDSSAIAWSDAGERGQLERSQAATMNKTLRMWTGPLRIPDAFRRVRAEPATPQATAAGSGFAHRADAGGAAAATDGVTKFAVVLLSSVNSVMWWVYTDSRLMGTVWAMIAMIFAIWMKRDAARR